MSPQPSELERIRQNYNERLDILRQSQVLFNKNKHRSIPNRGPYEYGLKVAREEFEPAGRNVGVFVGGSRVGRSTTIVGVAVGVGVGGIKPMRQASISSCRLKDAFARSACCWLRSLSRGFDLKCDSMAMARSWLKAKKGI